MSKRLDKLNEAEEYATITHVIDKKNKIKLMGKTGEKIDFIKLDLPNHSDENYPVRLSLRLDHAKVLKEALVEFFGGEEEE